jgi:NDP-sugar pyrophosphorylase family protein
MLDEPSRLYAMASDAYWIDIGTPEKYLRAHTDVLRAALGGSPAPGARELTKGVWVQGDPTIDPDARLEAPTLIGDGALVAAGARVVGSVVGDRAIVGPGARLLRSVVHADATLADEAEAIDAVVGAGAALGAGAIAADHTIVGAGAGLGPGARASGARIRRPEPDGEG